MPIMILDYYQKPASVHAFYKPCSFKVSVFCFVRCFCVFARGCHVSALCACATKWRVPCLSIQPLLILIGNGDPLCRGRDFRILDFRVETRNVCGFCENKQQINTCVSVTWSLFQSHNSEKQFSWPQINFHDSRTKFRVCSRPRTKFSNSGAFPVFPGPWEPCHVYQRPACVTILSMPMTGTVYGRFHQLLLSKSPS